MASQNEDHTSLLLHICPREDWQTALQRGEYRAASLDYEGFIHFSTPRQVEKTANRFYYSRQGLVLLVIDSARLQADLRYESADSDLFPHLYGPLNLDAVVEVIDFTPEADGTFHLHLLPVSIL